MEKSTNLTIAGILDLVVGSIVSAIALGLLVNGIVARTDANRSGMFLAFALLIVPGALAIVGGIHALRRKRWLLALVCSIFIAPIGSLITIPAIIMIIVSKKEFHEFVLNTGTVAPPTPSTVINNRSIPVLKSRSKPILAANIAAISLGGLEACLGLLVGLLILITDRGWRAYPLADSILAISSMILGALAVILGFLGIIQKKRKWAISGVVCAVVELIIIIILWVFR